MATPPTPASPLSEPPIKRAWKTILAWIAGITAVLGFLGTLTGTFHKLTDPFTHHKLLDTQVTLAQNQAKQDEYPQALQTLAATLKDDSHYAPALDAQLAIAEKWVENFRVESGPGQDPKPIAAAWLDQLFPIFDAAVLRLNGPQLADAQAHRGWTHWLNKKIAQRESGELAMQDLQAALATDPNDVYANAFLGHILITLQRLSEAQPHFDTALTTGKERTLVRRFQLGALTFDSEPGACAAAYEVANAMRQGNEPLGVDRKHDILSWCVPFDSASHSMRTESLSAVPRDDAWQTYLWLEEGSTDAPDLRELKHKFVQALLTEIAGDHAAALAQFRAMQNDKAARFTALDTAIPDELQRLTTKRK
jgi:tetratricopeptide (TPR) repeat protein